MKKPIVALAQIAGIALAFSVGMVFAQPAFATESPYNRAAADAYAEKWSCNGANCRNPAYQSLGGEDCTNFVSQALLAGGIHEDSAGALQWWYDKPKDIFGLHRSLSWALVTELDAYLVGSGKAVRVAPPSIGGKYSGAKVGDVYMYDWGKGEHWSHMGMATGSGNFANYSNYGSFFGGSGSFNTQHATDRDHAPWNYGYLQEPYASVKAKMRITILTIKHTT